MALIDLSDWLDRFGGASSHGVTTSELESLRIVASEIESLRTTSNKPTPGPLRSRWNRFWKRALRRFSRQPRGRA